MAMAYKFYVKNNKENIYSSASFCLLFALKQRQQPPLPNDSGIDLYIRPNSMRKRWG